MVYGSNFIGRVVVANAWATAFDIYDDGVDEQSLKGLPKYICTPMTKIVKWENYFPITLL